MSVSAELLRDRLRQGDRRSVGASGAVADAVRNNPALLVPLISFLGDDDTVLVAHAAHALMLISQSDPASFDKHAESLLRHYERVPQWEIGEQIPKILARARLSDEQLERFVRCLEDNLSGTSAIAAACALQAIVDLAVADRFDRMRASELLDDALGSDRKALSARARRLRKRLR